MTYIEELMTVLAEECAEVIQATCKIKRFGLDGTNLQSLAKELGDLQCMIEMCHEADLISYGKIEEYVQAKREKLQIYSEHLK
jgi:NTP pyrophosphatase (non-canonical NTP hydrolase)